MSERELVAKIRRLEIKLKDKGQEIDSLKFQLKEKNKILKSKDNTTEVIESEQIKKRLLKNIKHLERFVQSAFRGRIKPGELK